MTESSKDLAGAGSFGMKVHLHSRRGIHGEDLADLVVRTIARMGELVVERRGNLIGHIKAFLRVPDGTLQVNLVDPGLGPEKIDELPRETIVEADMKFMSALVGLSDRDVEDLMEKSLEVLQEKMEVEVREHHHEH